MVIIYQLNDETKSQKIYDDPVKHLQTLALVDNLIIGGKVYVVKRRLVDIESNEICIKLKEVNIK